MQQEMTEKKKSEQTSGENKCADINELLLEQSISTTQWAESHSQLVTKTQMLNKTAKGATEMAERTADTKTGNEHIQ